MSNPIRAAAIRKALGYTGKNPGETGEKDSVFGPRPQRGYEPVKPLTKAERNSPHHPMYPVGSGKYRSGMQPGPSPKAKKDEAFGYKRRPGEQVA